MSANCSCLVNDLRSGAHGGHYAARMPSPAPVLRGLCDSCRHQQVVRTKRSSFSLCRRWKEDDRYPRYPRLPVAALPRPRAASRPGARSDEDGRRNGRAARGRGRRRGRRRSRHAARTTGAPRRRTPSAGRPSRGRRSRARRSPPRGSATAPTSSAASPRRTARRRGRRALRPAPRPLGAREADPAGRQPRGGGRLRRRPLRRRRLHRRQRAGRRDRCALALRARRRSLDAAARRADGARARSPRA